MSETCGKCLLERILDRVGVESKLVQLVCHSLDIVGMAVSYAYDCMASVEVKVFLSLVVPYFTAETFVDSDIKEWVNIE